MKIKVLLILLFASNSIHSQTKLIFTPSVQKYFGYVSEVSWKNDSKYIGVRIYSKEYLKRVNFTFTNNRLTLHDTAYKIVFQYSMIPGEFQQFIKTVSEHEYIRSAPNMTEIKERKKRNKSHKYFITTAKCSFEAFNYKDLYVFKSTDLSWLLNLHSWGIWGKTVLPDNVEGSTDYLIITKYL